jgi:diguanylate cyclase (GGDEF)-like protein
MPSLSEIQKWKTGAIARLQLGRQVADGGHKLGYLHGSSYSILAWPLICILLIALLWTLTLSKLANERAVLKQNAFKHASSLSRAYAEQLARSVEQIDQITLTLKYYWKETHGTLQLEQQLREGLYPASGHLYVTIIDRRGARVASTLPARKTGPSVAFRDFFKQHRDDPTKGLLISPPQTGIRSGRTLIRFTRRLEAPNGAFSGLVVVGVEPVYLASFTDETALSNNDFVSVRRSDGSLLAAETGKGVDPLAAVFNSPPVFESDRGVAAMGGEKFADGQARIVAWHKLQNYPLVSTVGLSEQVIIDSYEAMARNYRHMAIAATVFLLLAAVVGMFVSSRLAWRKQQADEVKDAYRLATDGAREGFYMMRAMYDEQDNIVDFLFEDCNERGAAYYASTKARLIGMKFTDLYSATNAQHILGRYLRAMETGFYEDEVRVWPRSPLQATWIHRRLVRSGDGLAVTLRDISEMKAQEEALSRLANADAVTALPNRHWLINYLPDALSRARIGNSVLALLFVDLDDFKNINDTLGHAAGDELLQAVAARLQAVLRPQDNVVRLGGDEFTIILEHVDSHADVSRVAERIMKSLGEPFLLSGGSSHVMHASIGISMFPQDGNDGQTLLKHADIAMYAAKTTGKGHYEFYQPQLSKNLVMRLAREQALRKAIEHDEFILYYQPRVDTFSGQLRSMEALVRWRHPELGIVAPQEFIQMAEDNGLIVPLGEQVIRKACAQLAQWRSQHLPLLPVSINVSPRQFSHGNLSALIGACMAEHAIESSLIEIEITESCMMGEDQTVTAELAALEALGIKLLVDDFGTGYSSLSQLQRLDLDVLKVDRAFTAQLCNGREGEALFMAILSMAHVLGMTVVAEGVETLEQLRVLQALSCNEVQGYYISPPVPPQQMRAMMVKRFLFPNVEQPALAD